MKKRQKLTCAEVLEIYDAYVEGERQSTLAGRYGVSQPTISKTISEEAERRGDYLRETRKQHDEQLQRRRAREKVRTEERELRSEKTIGKSADGTDRLVQTGHGRFYGTCTLPNGKVKKWHAKVGASIQEARDAWARWYDATLFEFRATHREEPKPEPETAPEEEAVEEEAVAEPEESPETVEEKEDTELEKDTKRDSMDGWRKAYVLTFNRGGRVSKALYLFDTFDEAASVADALGVPLRISDAEGSYDVDEVYFWPKSSR